MDENIKNGLHTTYHENGQKKSEEKYKDGKEDGKVTRWYENGQIKNEGYFREGKLQRR